MFNQTLIWLLALPIILAIIVWYAGRRFEVSIPAALAYVAVAMIVISASFFIAKGSQTGDVELWNGQVTSKDRVHGTYEQAYECNCVTTTDANGNSSRTCQTCYETHYTVEWTSYTTIGSFRIEKYDKTRRSVYKSPDPAFYTSINVGDPVAKRVKYTNYIQAVPNSLFTPAASTLKAKFGDMLPVYPDNVYNFYNVDRFIAVNVPVPEQAKWNKDISLGLRTLGPQKEVNVIIVVAKTDDSDYEYALRDHWEGANKNDVVVIIGSTEYPKIDFVRILSWTKSEHFKVQLRDAILETGTIDRTVIMPLVFEQIKQNFERRRMREFKYLDGEIDPPNWLIYLLVTLTFAGAIGTHFIIWKR